MPPFKVTNKHTEIRWSKWIESMRKDVECSFGILKGRWQILKTGVSVQGVETVDKVWLTCCAFHIWLLDIDGLDKDWDGRNVPTSEWEGELGQLDIDGLPAINVVQLATASHFEPRNFDSLGMGPGEDIADGQEIHPRDLDEVVERISSTDDRSVCLVGNLGLGFFRNRLVEHYVILFKQNRLVWPEKRGSQPR